MVRRLGLGKNNHLTNDSLALSPRYVLQSSSKVSHYDNKSVKAHLIINTCINYIMFESQQIEQNFSRTIKIYNSVGK